MANGIIVKDEKAIDLNFRHVIETAEKKLKAMPGSFGMNNDTCPLKHSYGDGLYVREIFMPAHTIIISKLHKKTHPYFVLKGKATVVTEEGNILIEAPFQGMTKAGTKRALYIHEDCIWITVHATNETDLDKIEEEIIAKSYDEFLENEKIIEIEGGVYICHG